MMTENETKKRPGAVKDHLIVQQIWQNAGFFNGFIWFCGGQEKSQQVGLLF